MAQILDPIPPEQSEKILCCYVNATSKIQIARISNIANWYFERVVFPGQRLVFEAPLEGKTRNSYRYDGKCNLVRYNQLRTP